MNLLTEIIFQRVKDFDTSTQRATMARNKYIVHLASFNEALKKYYDDFVPSIVRVRARGQFNDFLIQVISDYRRGTGGRELAPIIGSAVNQILDFLTSTRAPMVK